MTPTELGPPTRHGPWAGVDLRPDWDLHRLRIQVRPLLGWVSRLDRCLWIPHRLEAAPVLVVRFGPVVAAIPPMAVMRVERHLGMALPSGDGQPGENRWLGASWGIPQPPAPLAALITRRRVWLVETVDGIRRLPLQPLSPLVERRGVIGAALSDLQPALVLDLEELDA